jgi:hypothetical protein
LTARRLANSPCRGPAGAPLLEQHAAVLGIEVPDVQHRWRGREETGQPLLAGYQRQADVVALC